MYTNFLFQFRVSHFLVYANCRHRFSSVGYVFSASLGPYPASSAITAINVLEEKLNLITKLKGNIAIIWEV